MELELGLALPSGTSTRGFDLNIQSYEALHCRNCLPCQVEEVFDEIKPALKGSNDPDGNDGRKNPNNDGSDSEGGDDLVGWPPIQSWRRKHHRYRQFQGGHGHDIQNNEDARPPGSMFVKVKMEGVAIGRKVDINRYNSHHTLTPSVIGMFGRYTSPGTTYVLAYQDREGNWLLVEDVPWQTFIQTVLRLKIQSVAN